MPTAAPYPYVYVVADGTARELHASERQWLETEFKGGDGNMPYVKTSYQERNGWGEIKGYLKRTQLPRRIAIADAPAEDPLRPRSREEYVAELRGKGMEVIEHDDGSLTVKPGPNSRF